MDGQWLSAGCWIQLTCAFGRFPSPGRSNFSSGCDFMMGLGKAQLHVKFEVASFSRCTNIKEKPQNFEKLL